MKKNQLKALKKLAEKLPITKELQKYSIAVQGYEIPADEYDPAVTPIEAEAWYKQGGHYRLVDVDHYNRLKKAYARNKEQGIVDYIFWVDNNNKKVNEIFETKEAERVSAELMEIAAKGKSNFWSNLINFLFAFIAIFQSDKKVA